MEVILYHTETCPQCKLFKMLLNQKHIDYVSVVDTNQMVAKGIKHTPTIEVDGVQKVGKEAIEWIKAQ